MARPRIRTEKQWLTSEHPQPMLMFRVRQKSARKLRLYACACCRRTWSLIPEYLRVVVEVAERYADGLATAEELDDEHRDSAPDDDRYEFGWPYQYDTGDEFAAAEYAAHMTATKYPSDAACLVAEAAADAASAPYPPLNSLTGEWAAQVELVRCLFGNPFRPVAYDPAWRTDTAGALARTMYESRDFSAMPILADALQDAGCDNPDVLNHCRNNGPHARGCGVVDWLLGKG